jgi:hypothetical protein
MIKDIDDEINSLLVFVSVSCFYSATEYNLLALGGSVFCCDNSIYY